MIYRALPDLVREHAAEQPARVALVTEAGQLSFADLQGRADRLAARLCAAGARRGDHIGFLLPRGVHCCEAILGILGTGAAFVPLDPADPPRRIAELARQARIGVLVTNDEHAGAALGVLRVVLIGDASDPVESPPPPLALDPSDVAYLIPTSGSTGAPKCVAVPHRALTHYVPALCRALALTEADRWMHSASFAFSASVRQLLVPLAAGASVLLAEAKHLRDPEALLALAAIGEATIIDSVPSYLSALAATLRSLPASRAAVARGPLRYVLSTGEPLPTGVAASLAEALPRARVVNLYGQTETCGSVSALVFDAADHAGGAQVPIGPAIGETVLAVLDEHDAPVPPGGAGELCVLGPSLAIEYFGRPELTEARFVASPLAEHGGARLYRTGDLVRPLPGGLALHVGRRDHQVKVNGIRVDLGEVEAAIRALPGIDEVAVTARDEPTGAQLIAYVVAGGDADADRAPLRAALAERLPEHMLPSRFVPLPALPRTSSGKVDRPALPWPLAEAEARAAGAPPTSGRDQLAAAVAEVFAEVLGRPVTDVGSDFFELGGDSMQATHAVVRLRESLPLGVSWMSVFFENPSPMAIAEALETESDPELLSTWMTRVRSDH